MSSPDERRKRKAPAVITGVRASARRTHSRPVSGKYTDAERNKTPKS